MAYVLGFGTVWTDNGVYTNDSGNFTGLNATAVWQSDFGQLDDLPDAELGGGSGTANAHWNEPDGGGAFSGITDSMGRDMTFELMTGWLNQGSFISDMTVASFRDIGFTTANATAVPEPSGIAGLVLVGAAYVAGRRRRRKPEIVGVLSELAT
ncbi:PEP-CTERM protein-sorting domain-containing protein/MYXO-CTERM domain-containing protein [Neorhodopirellula lusitana]|uniref:PEP-CTERM protein-sorting domain-containing protein/MYXO-CTERM domain-containing protein n=1 Tax=Neorhodopirellula lusitana TaxID=445327 RepID=A0ABY1QNH3_9BACT|nr:PEP-CTERM sorting domain-containing protein [Neorhodopirellula lusitana]SMP76310.1 PEP-CTERM protein-sorting domain-containing protein/MYXO-CTERM domain-containing protein [Neorhodopirellula lusitana]